MSVNLGTATGYLDLDTKKFKAGFNTALGQLNTFRDKSQNTSTRLKGLGGAMSSVGSTLTRKVTAPLVGIGAAAVAVTAKFDSKMSKVKAISGATGKDFKLLRDRAMEMGAKTKFSASESAEALKYMAMAGWKSKQMYDALPGVMNLAAASGENLGVVSDIVTDSMTAFGLSAKKAGYFADVLAKASSSSNTNVSLLGESFKYVAPIAGSLGYNVKDTSIALGLMANAGIKGSQAGTSLRMALTQMSSGGGKAAKVMRELGIKMTDAKGNMLPLRDVMVQLRTKFAGLSKEQKIQAASTLFGKNAMSGMMAIINASDKDFNTLTKAIDNSSGSAKKMADEMNNNLKGQLTLLKSALEGLAIHIGDALTPMVRKVVKAVNAIVDKLNNMPKGLRNAIVYFGLFAASIGPILLVGGKLVSAFGSVLGAVGKLKGAMTAVGEGFKLARAGFVGLGSQASVLSSALGAISAPVLAVVAVIGVLVAAFVYLWKTNKKFRQEITTIWNSVVSAFKTAVNEIKAALFGSKATMSDVVKTLKIIWKGLCDVLAPLFTGSFKAIASFLKGAIKIITGILQVFIGVFKGIFKGDWSLVWAGAENIVKGVITHVKGYFLGIGTVLKGVVNSILGWFGTDINSIVKVFKNAWNTLKSWFSNFWAVLKSIVTTGIQAIGLVLKAVFTIVTLPFRFVWENCKNIVVKVLNSIKNTITKVMTSVLNFIRPILNKIKSIFSAVWGAIKNIVSKVVSSIKNTITRTWSSIKSVTSRVWNAIKSAITKPFSAVKNTVGSIVGAIKSRMGFSGLVGKVRSVWSAVKSAIVKPVQSAWNLVKSAASKLKNAFNFHWSLPHLKLPHIHVSGGKPPYGIAGKGSLPKFSVDWYAKAMNNGLILNKPTIFGMRNGRFLGGGEAGSEAVVGTSSLMSMIKKSVLLGLAPFTAQLYSVLTRTLTIQSLQQARLMSFLVETTSLIVGALSKMSVAAPSAIGTLIGETKLTILIKQNEKLHVKINGLLEKLQSIDNRILELCDKISSNSNGDTYNFYSPKPLDETTIMLEAKRKKKELLEGFT